MPRFWSWQSCEWSVIREGQPAVIHTLIRSVGYSDGSETALVHAAGRDPVGTTDPVYMPGEMSIEMLAKWYRQFAADATNNGELRLSDLDFRMVVKRKSRTEAEAIVDEIDFQITNAEDSGAQGSPDPLVTAVTGQITKIKRNGVVL